METHPQNPLSAKWTKWQQLGTWSSPWTTETSNFSFYAILLFVTFAHLIFAATFPLTDDELYYWTWSRALQSSYFDHPPMVAYLIRFATTIFGQNAFAIRLPAVIIATIIMLISAKESEKTSVLVWFLFTPLFLLGAVVMSPDIPLILFWSLYLWWLGHVTDRIEKWNSDPVSRVYNVNPISHLMWLPGGIFLGLGIMSKYTMLLAIPMSAISLFINCRWRAWIVGFVLHIGIAFVISLPIFAYNYHNNYASFLFQWHHAITSQGGFHLRTLADFLGSQVLLAGLLPFLLLPMCMFQQADRHPPKFRIYRTFFLCCLFFFCFQALRKKLEANWALVTYISFLPVAQFSLEKTSFRYLNRGLMIFGMVIPFAMSFLVLLHLYTPFRPLGTRLDRIQKYRERYAISQEIKRDFGTGSPIIVDTYQWASYLAYQGIPVFQEGGRPSEFTLRPPNTDKTRLTLVQDDFHKPEPPPAHCKLEKEYLKSDRFYLLRCTK